MDSRAQLLQKEQEVHALREAALEELEQRVRNVPVRSKQR
jgi:hypothetical protein